MDEEELEYEDLDDELEEDDSFEQGYNRGQQFVEDANDFYNKIKESKNSSDSGLPKNENINNQNIQSSNDKPKIENNQNKNIQNNNDIVRQERLNSLKNGGNEAAKEALNKGASNASSNAGLGAQIASSAQNVSEDMKQPTVDKEGNELDGIDAVKQKGLDASKSIGREAGNIAGEIVSDYFTVQSGGASQVFKPLVKAIASKTSEIATVQATKQLYLVIGLVASVLLFILIAILFIIFGSEELGNSGYGSIGYVPGYESCSSITVKGMGTYPLEEYVAGVITHEAYPDGGDEALKAQAVTSRSYVIKVTDNCTKTIENSTSAQTFSENPSEAAIEAANSTAGQVLTYDNDIVLTMYDSFCYADNDCSDAVKNADGTYSVTYTKLPNNEKHTITLSDSKQYNRILPGQGHARGMSQLLSYQMSSEGKKYDEILKYFYSDGVQISSINKVINQYVATEIPTSVDDLKNRYYFTFDIDNYTSGTNFGQCVWYAKHRAMDIVNSSNLSKEEKERRINSINSTRGNGQDWYANMDGSIFKKTTNIDEIKPGSIISWRTSQHIYGHVGIIEDVKIDSNGNKVFYITDGGRKQNENGQWYTVEKSQLWSVFSFYSVPDAPRSVVEKRWRSYSFIGAVSLLD